MPRARSKVTKKGKNPSARGKARQVIHSETETEDSEHPSSPDVKPLNSQNSASLSSPQASDNTQTKYKKGNEVAGTKINNNPDDGWKYLPSLVDDMKLKGEKFPYITKDYRHREFELNERKELLQLKNDISFMRDTFDHAIAITQRLHPEAAYGRVSNTIRMLGFPKTFKELVLKLMSVTKENGLGAEADDRFGAEPLFEESDQDIDDLFSPIAKKPPTKFPSPTKMAKFTTPKTNGVFHFGGLSTQKGILSTNKAPRLPKPGELTYSQGGSPILQRRLPDNVHEQLEVINADGSKVEVDIVYRGTNYRAIHDFSKDVRGLVASRSTVKQNRILPPKINAKGMTQSASKKNLKPEWR